MNYRWSVAPSQPLLADHLARQLNILPLLAQCLLNRGLSDPASAGHFLRPQLRSLADPFELPDMGIAVDRLFFARENDQPLVIFGDYDVDGVTSTALLLEVLRTLGWNAQSYLPHRRDEGYGLSREAVENCLKKFPCSLLLAVDCGSSSADTIAWLKEKGVDVIVLDHHQFAGPPPPAVALVNPVGTRCRASASAKNGDHAQPTCWDEYCSAGLAFKLAHALVKRGREKNLPGAAEFDVRHLLDLVALGTIADLVPLTGENRILASAGLERLNRMLRPGIETLVQVAQSPRPLGPYEVSFQLAPRLNAAGRLENAEEALHLLMAPNSAEALPIAQRLDARNRERRDIERTIATQAATSVRSRFNPEQDFVIVEGQPTWHIGVVGIVASRLVQEFYRPSLVLGGDGDEWRGSGRSIRGFDLAAALRECDDLLIRHGGHAMAAGLSILPGKVDEFRSRLNGLARQTLKPEHLQPELRLDAEVCLGDLSLESLAALDSIGPVGQANPAIQLAATGLTHQRPLQRMGPEKQHVKMWVSDGKTTHQAVWWRGGAASLPVGPFDLAFVPQINEYEGRRSIQLKVLDWRPALT